MKLEKRIKYVKVPVCCECAKELVPERDTYESASRKYCADCERLGRAKTAWRPIGNAKISRMFFVKD